MKLDILLNKKKGDTLNNEELQLVNEIKKDVYKLINNMPVDGNNYDKVYVYAKLAKYGIIEDDKETIDYIFETILYNSLFDCNAESLFETYPILLEYVDDVLNHLDLTQLEVLSCYYYNKEDYNNYFKICKTGANYELRGMLGGFQLVNTLITIDNFKYQLACCYMYGQGTKPNYVEAFNLFLEYRRDHLVYKNGSDSFTEEDLSYLYNKLKEDYENGKRYPGLLYSLAVMYREGIGTNYNLSEYKNYSNLGLREYICKNKLTKDKKLYSTLLCNYVNDYTINNEINGEQINNLCTFDNIEVGKVIELGKYDHRSILWKVLDIKDGKVLLLSTNVLDTTYPIISKSDFIEGSLKYFKYQIKFVDDIKFELKYLTKAEVNKYLPLENRLCFSRKQAQTNGSEGYGVKVDEENGFAAWYTGTKVKKDEPFIYYVDIDGKINSCWGGAEFVGLRPALLLDLTKDEE